MQKRRLHFKEVTTVARPSGSLQESNRLSRLCEKIGEFTWKRSTLWDSRVDKCQRALPWSKSEENIDHCRLRTGREDSFESPLRN